jgi:RNA polymerase sigma-70 factor (ECF subfamily)
MYRAHFMPLCRFVASYVRAPDIAEEIVQEVLWYVWEHRATWDVHRGIRAYLFGAARNRALNELQRSGRAERWGARLATEPEPPGIGLGSVASADASLAARSLPAAVEHAIRGLPEGRRTVLRLRWQHAMSYAEIASVVGSTVKAVEMQLNRTLNALRKTLGAPDRRDA